MWDATHDDGGQHGLSDGAVAQKRLGSTHRLIIAHVLVHGQDDAGFLADFDCLHRFSIITTKWLLREDALSCAAFTCGLNDIKLIVGWYCNVEHFDRLVVEELID